MLIYDSIQSRWINSNGEDALTVSTLQRLPILLPFRCNFLLISLQNQNSLLPLILHLLFTHRLNTIPDHFLKVSISLCRRSKSKSRSLWPNQKPHSRVRQRDRHRTNSSAPQKKTSFIFLYGIRVLHFIVCNKRLFFSFFLLLCWPFVECLCVCVCGCSCSFNRSLLLFVVVGPMEHCTVIFCATGALSTCRRSQ